jgi:hypothetical protein
MRSIEAAVVVKDAFVDDQTDPTSPAERDNDDCRHGGGE